jgi:tight adherence protein C
MEWQSWFAPTLVALACAGLLTLLIVLRKSPPSVDTRGDAWRDPPPPLLRMLQPILKAYAYTIDSGLTLERRDTLQERINAAGASYLLTPAEFLVTRRLAFLITLALALYGCFMLGVRNPASYATFGALAVPAYFYPDLWLRERTAQRHRAFQKNFPFFVEVLVLCMKAGLTFAAAVEQAVEQVSAGAVKEEFMRYLRETRTGVQRRVALERLAARVRLPALSNFSAAVSQAEESGGSLGDVLSDQARQRRQERFQRAEKMAAQAPVKMLAPLFLLLFPITFMMLAFPIYQEVKASGIFN